MILNKLKCYNKLQRESLLFFANLTLSMSKPEFSLFSSTEKDVVFHEKKKKHKADVSNSASELVIDKLSSIKREGELDNFDRFSSLIKHKISNFKKYTKEFEKYLMNIIELNDKKDLKIKHLMIKNNRLITNVDLILNVNDPTNFGTSNKLFVYCLDENCQQKTKCRFKEFPLESLVSSAIMIYEYQIMRFGRKSSDDQSLQIMVFGDMDDSDIICDQIKKLFHTITTKISNCSPDFDVVAMQTESDDERSVIEYSMSRSPTDKNKSANNVTAINLDKATLVTFDKQSQKFKIANNPLTDYIRFFNLNNEYLFEQTMCEKPIQSKKKKNMTFDTDVNHVVSQSQIERIEYILRDTESAPESEIFCTSDGSYKIKKSVYRVCNFILKNSVRMPFEFCCSDDFDFPRCNTESESLKLIKILINSIKNKLKYAKASDDNLERSILEIGLRILDPHSKILSNATKPKKNLAQIYAKMKHDLENSELTERTLDKPNSDKKKFKIHANNQIRSADKNIQQKTNLPNSSCLRTVSHNDHDSTSTSIENSTVNATKSIDKIFDDNKLQNSKAKETIRAESIVHQSFRNPSFDIDVKMNYPEIYTTSGISRKQFEEECFIKKEKIKTRKNIPGVSGLAEPVTNTINDNTKTGKKNVQIKSNHNLINSESEAQAEVTQKKFKKNLNDTKKIKKLNCSQDKLSITELNKKNPSFLKNTEIKPISLSEEYLANDQEQKKNKRCLNSKKKARSDAYFKKVLTEQVVYE